MKQVSLNPLLNLQRIKFLSWAKVHVRIKGLQHRVPARKQTVGDGRRILEHVYTRIEKELPWEHYQATSIPRIRWSSPFTSRTHEKSNWLRETRVLSHMEIGLREDPFFVYSRIPPGRHRTATFHIVSDELLEFIAMLSSRRMRIQ